MKKDGSILWPSKKQIEKKRREKKKRNKRKKKRNKRMKKKQKKQQISLLSSGVKAAVVWSNANTHDRRGELPLFLWLPLWEPQRRFSDKPACLPDKGHPRKSHQASGGRGGGRRRSSRLQQLHTNHVPQIHPPQTQNNCWFFLTNAFQRCAVQKKMKTKTKAKNMDKKQVVRLWCRVSHFHF